MTITTLGIRKETPRPRVARRRNFNAGAWSRLTGDWLGPILSADRTIEGSFRTLRGRARELVRNNPHAAAAVRVFEDNVVGPHGLRCQAMVAFQNGNLREDLNDHLEERWREFCRPEYFSANRQLHCADFQRLVIAGLVVDGEVLIRHRRAFPNGHGYAVQLLDPDQLDSDYNRFPADGQNEIRYGVEIDGNGAVVAYHITERHPSETTAGRRRTRVPARDIIHWYRPQRPGQTRGITPLAPAMLRLHELDAFDEATIVAARVAAASPIVYEQDPEVYQQEDTEAPAEGIEVELEPGQNQLLPPGVKASMLSPEHPSTTFESFERCMLQAIAAGFGLSYASLTQDLSSTSYSSARTGLLAERDVFRTLARQLSCYVLTPIYREWLTHAALSGAVQLPSMEVVRYWAVAFDSRGWDWVDPRADIEAIERAIALGITTRTRVAGERGTDFYENLRQLAQEQELAAELGVSIGGLDRSKGASNDDDGEEREPADDAADDAARAGRVRLVRRAG